MGIAEGRDPARRLSLGRGLQAEGKIHSSLQALDIFEHPNNGKERMQDFILSFFKFSLKK